jgi:hypothetical protein
MCGYMDQGYLPFLYIISQKMVSHLYVLGFGMEHWVLCNAYGTGCRMDIPGPTTSIGTRTDYSVGPWDYPTCAALYLMAWSARTMEEEYSDRKLCMS